jgi:hypothetical protein
MTFVFLVFNLIPYIGCDVRLCLSLCFKGVKKVILDKVDATSYRCVNAHIDNCS